MRRRGCLFGCSGALLVVLLVCGLAYFVGLPRFQDALRDGLSEELSTQVAKQIDTQLPRGATLTPGEYPISLPQLERRLDTESTEDQISGVKIQTDGNALVLSLSSSGQTLEYRGIPTVNSSGDLEMTDMTSSGGALDFVLPPDELGGAVEQGVNSYFDAQGASLQDVQLTESELILDVGS